MALCQPVGRWETFWRKPGDWIYVTGTLGGDSAAGLAILRGDFRVGSWGCDWHLVKRHLRPTPRILQGQALRDLASSAIDLFRQF